jgi:hypothetical protein
MVGYNLDGEDTNTEDDGKYILRQEITLALYYEFHIYLLKSEF